MDVDVRAPLNWITGNPSALRVTLHHHGARDGDQSVSTMFGLTVLPAPNPIIISDARGIVQTGNDNRVTNRSGGRITIGGNNHSGACIKWATATSSATRPAPR